MASETKENWTKIANIVVAKHSSKQLDQEKE
jgi:hypothetical protein